MYPLIFIEKIEKLVAQGKTQNALKELNHFPSTKNNPDLKNQLILLTARWHHYQRNQLENIQPNSELNKELNRINKGILSILEENLVQVAPSSNKYPLWPPKKNNYFLPALIIITIALLLFLLFYLLGMAQ